MKPIQREVVSEQAGEVDCLSFYDLSEVLPVRQSCLRIAPRLTIVRVGGERR